MYQTVATLSVPMIVMHMRGTPQTMNTLANYGHNVIDEVGQELQETIRQAQENGVLRWALVGDPGKWTLRRWNWCVSLLLMY